MRLVEKTRVRLGEEQVKVLWQWIDAAQRQQRPLFEDMERWRRKYRGSRRDTGDQDDGQVEVNLAYAHVETLVPTVVAQDPYIRVRAPREQDQPKVKTFEAVINGTIQRIRFKQTLRRNVKDAAILKEGWCKVGWVGSATRSYAEQQQGGASSEPGRPGQAAFVGQDLLQQALGAGAMPGVQAQEGGGAGGVDAMLSLLMEELGAAPAGSTGARAELKASVETSNNAATWLSKGQPFVQRVRPSDVLVDPLVAERDPNDARWIAVRYVLPLDEIEAKYGLPKKLDQSKLLTRAGAEHVFGLADPMGKYTDDLDRQRWADLPDGVKLGVVWEVWVHQLVGLDLWRQQVVLLEGSDEALRQPIGFEEFFGESPGFPIKRLTMVDVPDDWPMGELESWDKLSRLVSFLLAKTAGNVRRFSRMYEVNENKIKSRKEVTKLKHGKDGTVVFVEDGDAIKAIPQPTGTSEGDRLLQSAMNLLELVSGLSENRRGAVGARTATEAAIVDKGSTIRTQDRGGVVMDFAKEVVVALVGVIKRNVDESYVMRMADSAGGVEWLRFGPDNLRWSPDIEIDPKGTRAQDQQEELMRWQQVIQMCMLLVQLGFPIDMRVPIGEAMKAFDVPNVAGILGSGDPSPEVQQLVEIAQMMAGIPVPIEPTDAHPMHLEAMAKFEAQPEFPVIVQNSHPLFPQLFKAHMGSHQAAMSEMAAAAGKQAASQAAGPYARSGGGGGGSGQGGGAQAAEGQAPSTPANAGRRSNTGGKQGQSAAPAVKGAGNQRRV